MLIMSSCHQNQSTNSTCNTQQQRIRKHLESKRDLCVSVSILSIFLCLALNGGDGIGIGLLKVDAFTTTRTFPSVTRQDVFQGTTTSHSQMSHCLNKDNQCGRIVLHESTHAVSIKDVNSNINEFTPTTATLTKSMIFFTKYLVEQFKEDRLKKILSNRNKKGIFSKFRRSVNVDSYDPLLVERLNAEIEKEESEEKPFSETLTKLNKARKDMTALVGYDAALLVPCFGFAGLAAIMNSIIPHFYGLCINCLANAATTSQHDVVKAITGLAVVSFLCALFTGVRGALFWLAGTFRLDESICYS